MLLMLSIILFFSGLSNLAAAHDMSMYDRRSERRYKKLDKELHEKEKEHKKLMEIQRKNYEVALRNEREMAKKKKIQRFIARDAFGNIIGKEIIDYE